MSFTVAFIRVVPTLSGSITELVGGDAERVVALELARRAFEGSTISRFVESVSTVILRVTLPPERDAVEGCLTNELRTGTVASAAATIGFKDIVLRTGTSVATIRSKETESGAVGRVTRRGPIEGRLTDRMIDLQIHRSM